LYPIPNSYLILNWNRNYKLNNDSEIKTEIILETILEKVFKLFFLFRKIGAEYDYG